MCVNLNHSCRVLLIEDNQDFSDLLCAIFDLLGHQPVAANDGMRGIEIAKEFLPNIIFCDIGLPGMNGYDFARKIRRMEQFRSIYLVALSGYVQQKHIRDAIEAGYNCHIAKPVDMVTMRQVLSKVQSQTQPNR